MVQELPDQPAFLLVRLRSCDDLEGIHFTLAGSAGERPGLWLNLTLPYDARLLALPPFTQRTLTLEGYTRRFSVLSVEPAPDATAPGAACCTWPAPVPVGARYYQAPAWDSIRAWLDVADYLKNLKTPWRIAG